MSSWIARFKQLVYFACLCAVPFTVHATLEDLLAKSPEINAAIESVVEAFDQTRATLSIQSIDMSTFSKAERLEDILQTTTTGPCIALHDPTNQTLCLLIFNKHNDTFFVVRKEESFTIDPDESREENEGTGEDEDTTDKSMDTAALRTYLLRNPAVRGYPLPRKTRVGDILLRASAGLGACSLALLLFGIYLGRTRRDPADDIFWYSYLWSLTTGFFAISLFFLGKLYHAINNEQTRWHEVARQTIMTHIAEQALA